jgi:O-antigen/teichoic acid export membrane protein
VFLHFWSSNTLAAWLSIYAAGNLMLVADCGLHIRSVNQFLAFRTGAQGEEQAANFYRAMLRIYIGLMTAISAGLLIAMVLLPPSVKLGFMAIPHFDLALGIMTLGMLPALVPNVTAALYRAHGYYGRVVWLQCVAMLIAQIGQLAAVTLTGSLVSVTVAYIVGQLAMSVYIVFVDAPRLFPFLRKGHATPSARWMVEQFRRSIPFGIAAATELALANAPVLLVSAFVADRMAVVQWGLTRIVAGLVRALCTQATLPVAAELGQDYAGGRQDKLQELYARGSMLLSLAASAIVSGLLAFWPDFFALWTHGEIAYDAPLMLTLLIGTAAVTPSILAASFANYSNRGRLLASTKSVQLVLFLLLCVVLIPRFGPLGVASAIVFSDVAVQLGWLTGRILWQTLKRPLKHVACLAAVIVFVTLAGWAVGAAIRAAMPGQGLLHFVGECALWLLIAAMIASPLSNGAIRARLAASIPN